ncbi:rap1 GTPase-GDP dissociation stimulator 1-like isoform X1 [Haliotis rufescens]|uniref:rap1 GTPase-GDP dissociation stimulator 1-like isoform X1 n=1 Tax=Haliotis rufescens TaxID=6454 RepID=UPI001EB0301B|nr:rap1 GTPase-GDP dissociation stimulator 1-like isoform X1 [Haliotis rufescens]
MDEVLPLIEQLKITEDLKAREEYLDKLTDLISESEDGEDDLSEPLLNSGILEDVLKLLINSSDSSFTSKCAQLVAELAKTESLRGPLVERGFVPPLLQLLNDKDVQLATQGCRALGNICYDNDAGRNAVEEANAMKQLLDLLRTQLKNDAEGADRLRTIACGFLLNLTNTHEALQEKALEEDVLKLLDQCLQLHLTDQGLTNMTLLTISSIADSDYGKEMISESEMPKTLVTVLASKEGESHQDTILDLLISLADSDKIKDTLADTSLSNHLIKIIQCNTGRSDDDSLQCVKMASDLLVSLLVGDKSMEQLFGGGEGPVFMESVKWLEGDTDTLKVSGALAIGNFARSDEHCHLLVEDGVMDKLLELVRQEAADTKEHNITLQHAVLSALRNLAIPAPNKPRMLKAGVLDVVLKLSQTEVMAVAFKLLGLIRMLIDSQEAASKSLGCDRDFLMKLVEWCGVEGHAGVTGEATRLLAWLIKHSKSSDVMKNIIKNDGIQYLVSMATSEHVVMQNEALFSLTLICSTVLGDAAVPLKEADLATTITTLLKNPATIPEILCNTLSLTRSICTAASPTSPQALPCSLLACTGILSDVQNNLREELVASGIADITRELSLHGDEKVKEVAKSVLAFIDDSPVNR